VALGGSLGLGIVITASDLASGAIKSVAKSFAGLDDAATKAQEKFAARLGKGLFGGMGMEPTLAILKDLGKATGVMALGVAGLTGAFKLADEASDFEFRLAELRNTTKLSTDQVEAFRKKSLELGASGSTGPRSVSDAFRELASSTLTGKQALDALEPTVDLLHASFNRLSPEQAGGLVAKTLEAFPELANNSTHAVDLLARAFKGGLKPEEIARAMERAARGSKFLGTSLEEVLTTLGGSAGAGLQVSRLSEQTVKAASHTDKFALAAERMRRALGDSTVTARSSAAAMESTWKSLRGSISAALETLALEVGMPLLDAFKPVLQFVVSGLQSLTKFVVNLSAPVKKTFAQFFVLGSVALILGGLKMAFVALLPVIGSVAAALAPLLLTGALIAGAAYLIYKAWDTNFGGLRDAVEEVFGKVKLAVLSLVELFTKGEISGALADDLLKAENGGVYDFVEAISRAVASIRETWTEIGPDVISVFQSIKTIAEPIVKGMIDAFKGLSQAVGGAFIAVAGILSGNFKSIYRGVAMLANGGIDILNGMIGVIAKIPGLGKSLEGVKLEKFKAEEIASLFGDTAGAVGIQDEDRRRAEAAAGGPVSSSGAPPSSTSATATTGGVSPTVATASLPSSRPAVSSAPAQSTAAIEQLVAAIEALGKRPVVVNGVVTIDGMKLADWQAKERRDRAAAAGTIHRPYHGFGHDSEQ
jgi:hypothetical protein